MNFYLAESGDLINLSNVRYFIIRPSYGMSKENSWWLMAYFSETDHRLVGGFDSEEEAKKWINDFLVEYVR